MSKTSQLDNMILARNRRSRDDMTDIKLNSLPTWIVALALALLAGGCRQDPEQVPELEAVDVISGPVVDIADDPKAAERTPELVGVLPDDFPDDLPLYLPASLVDFGTVDDGWVYVNLLTPHSLARVERELSALLTERGWATVAAGEAQQLRRGNARVRLLVEDARPGTQYRFEYPG